MVIYFVGMIVRAFGEESDESVEDHHIVIKSVS